jgi:predicted MFS family arabinose efflux permease
MAITVVSMGSGVGMFAAIPYTHLLIGNLGWQSSLVALALTVLVMLPLAFVIGDKGTASLPRDLQARIQPIREALGEALRLPRFWLLTAGFFVCGFHVMFVAVHLPAFVVDKGLAAWLGAAALSIVGVFNLIGTYIAGTIADKIGKPVVLSWLYALRAVVFLGFLYVPITETSVLVLCGLLGLLWLATVPITSSLVATFFGPTWMSMLYGIVFFSHQVGAFFGVWLGGYVYDATQSYDIVWWMCVGLAVVSALLHLPIKELPVARLRAETA